MFAERFAQRIYLVILGVLNASCRTTGIPVSDSSSTSSSALPSGIFPLVGLDPNLPATDLTPIVNSVANAQVVGLGEENHTSGGFHQAKVRVIEQLIAQQDFRALAFESNWLQAIPANDFALSGRGTAVSAASGLFLVFQSKEVVDLFAWIRQFNLVHHDDQVRIFGFDVQGLSYDANNIKTFLAVAAPSASSTLLNGIATCTNTNASQSFGPATSTDLNSCLSGISAIQGYFQANQPTLVAASSQQNFELASISLASLRAGTQSVFYYNNGNTLQGASARDTGMAAVFPMLRHTLAGDAKTLIWAHTGHVMKRNEQAQQPFVTKNMGSYLEDTYGVGYRAIATTAYNVQLAPWWTGEGTLSTPVPGSVEALLNVYNQPTLFMSADSALLNARTFYAVSHFNAIPADQFDGIIFMQTSPPMTPIPGIVYPPAPSTATCPAGALGSDTYSYASWTCNGKDVLSAAQSLQMPCIGFALNTNNSTGTFKLQFQDGCLMSIAIGSSLSASGTAKFTMGAINCSSGCNQNECAPAAASSQPEVDTYTYSMSANKLTLTDTIIASNLGDGGYYDKAGCQAGDVESIVAVKP